MARCEMRAFSARCGRELAQEIWLQCSRDPSHVSREGCCVICGGLLRGLLSRLEADCLQCRAQKIVAKMREIPALGARPEKKLTLPGHGGLALPPGMTN